MFSDGESVVVVVAGLVVAVAASPSTAGIAWPSFAVVPASACTDLQRLVVATHSLRLAAALLPAAETAAGTHPAHHHRCGAHHGGHLGGVGAAALGWRERP